MQVTLVPLSAEEARRQLIRIKAHWQAFWFELQDFHQKRGWVPLGYTSFKSCVEQELGFTEQRAYQLLAAAAIRLELETQPGLSLEALTERHARELTRLPSPEA